jgi:hypothetical protein
MVVDDDNDALFSHTPYNVTTTTSTSTDSNGDDWDCQFGSSRWWWWWCRGTVHDYDSTVA